MKKRIFLYILFAVMLLTLVSPSWAQGGQNYYREQLKELILGRPRTRSGVFRFLGSGMYGVTPGPEFYPIAAFHDPNAVPFLINVLQNGPNWSDDEFPKWFPRERADMNRYVARCYAALCLGYIGDSRAFDLLLEILNNKNIETYPHRPRSPRKDEYNLRAYAAYALGYLGDRRAVEPLIKSLKEDGFNECIYALTRLQTITAVPVIIQVASERNMFGNYAINNCLEYMLKVRFTSRDVGKGRTYQIIDQFPELGIVHVRDKRRILWKHWIKAGNWYAKEWFYTYYGQWRDALKYKPDAHSLHRVLKQGMLKGGVAAIPYMIAEIEKGDDSLIPIVVGLTRARIPRRTNLDPKISENATRDETLEWWKNNKHKWLIFDPNEQYSYDELLRKAVINRALDRTGVYNFQSSYSGRYPPRTDFSPIIGLGDPHAVPFLLDVLHNGPDWSEDNLTEFHRPKADMWRYLARCYAALCLGSIGDSRAFDPLLAILNDTDIKPNKDGDERIPIGERNLRAYTAFALGLYGDRKAVEPLIKSLREDGFIECIYALVRLEAVTAVPVIVQVASERKMFRGTPINTCLEYLLKIRFTIWTAGEDRKYQIINQFPQVGAVHFVDANGTSWQHWLKAGDSYAKEQFEEYYPQWKAAFKNKPDAHNLHSSFQEKMLRGGVAVVPYLIAEIEEGDDALIPVVAKLVEPRIPRIKERYPELSEVATRDETLEWWKKNKQNWIIFQPVNPAK